MFWGLPRAEGQACRTAPLLLVLPPPLQSPYDQEVHVGSWLPGTCWAISQQVLL